MRKRKPITIIVTVFVAIASLNVAAKNKILDRIVAIVDGHIITLSDIRSERAMRDILGEQRAANDREILDDVDKWVRQVRQKANINIFD